MANEEYIKKWLDGSLSPEDMKVFQTSDEYKSLQKLDAAVKSFKAPYYDVQQELERINSGKRGKGKVVHLGWINTMVRIAAVLLVLFSSYFFFYLNVDVALETASAEKSELFLPDDSKVALNAHSRVTYKKNMWKFSRNVQLDGEAFFSVAKGSRFDVETSGGVISVLGTQFNVKSRENYFEVVCYEGLVQVQSLGEVSKLTTGNVFRILNGKTEVFDKDYSPLPDWMANESVFRSVPFGQVIHEFERQYRVIITTKNIDLNQLFTGKFVHDNLEVSLKAISIPLNLKYEIGEQNQVILSARSE
jgi:transmembrane sensor